MYKVDLPIDYKEAAAIERRRNMEEMRKSRIFNAKTRLIGVDVQALDQQMQDRKQMEERERRRKEAYGRLGFNFPCGCLCGNLFGCHCGERTMEWVGVLSFLAVS